MLAFLEGIYREHFQVFFSGLSLQHLSVNGVVT